jgi:hypothetical protein
MPKVFMLFYERMITNNCYVNKKEISSWSVLQNTEVFLPVMSLDCRYRIFGGPNSELILFVESDT